MDKFTPPTIPTYSGGWGRWCCDPIVENNTLLLRVGGWPLGNGDLGAVGFVEQLDVIAKRDEHPIADRPDLEWHWPWPRIELQL